MIDATRPEYEVLWRQARTAVRRGQAKLGYKAPTPQAAVAVSSLLGRLVEAGVGTTVPVADLDARVQERFGVGLSELLTEIHGEHVEYRDDHAATDAAGRSQADGLLWAALASAGLSEAPWAGTWVDQVRRYAKIDPSHLAQPARQAGEVLAQLHLRSDAPPETWLSRVEVARTAGDPYALDPGRKTANLVLRAAALAHNVPLPKSRRDETRLWERSGLTDGVASTVLAFGFPGMAGPSHLPLRALADLFAYPTNLGLVRVCFRPRLVEAAADTGRRTPLVCLSGHLGPTTRVLLTWLTETGVPTTVHTDFDAAALTIATQVLTLTNGTPWRLTADDYRAALDHARHLDIDLPPLDTDPPPTPWSPDLPAAMRAGWAIPEEVVTDLLLTDL